jgi:hypothetical protein
MDEEMVERVVARAMWNAVVRQAVEIGMPVSDDGFNSLHPDDQVRQLYIARAAIDAHKAALAEAGYVIVPREPSVAMLVAGRIVGTNHRRMEPRRLEARDAGTCWQAMIGAAE